MTVLSSFIPHSSCGPINSELTDQKAAKLDLKDLPIFEKNLNALIERYLEDFPEESMKNNEISQYAAHIAQANITQDT
ncbi:hypothetical protein BGW80DRAFT_1465438 [Lactifluus volemus]|nr:hypothetical protein BGW80DRAFT_1465438 [Lactifluus volemus]